MSDGGNDLTFDDWVDLLRVRIGLADAVNPSEFHSFRTLMDDHKDQLPEEWYWEAFDDLDAQGHLQPGSSRSTGGDASGRLSSEGRMCVSLKAAEAD